MHEHETLRIGYRCVVKSTVLGYDERGNAHTIARYSDRFKRGITRADR